MSDVLKDRDLDRYYQERFRMTGSKGWEDWMQEVEALRDGYNSIEAARDERELYFRKGQVDILNMILSLGPVARTAYDQLLEQEQDESV